MEEGLTMLFTVGSVSFFVGFFAACLLYERWIEDAADAMRQSCGFEFVPPAVLAPTRGWKSFCREASCFAGRARDAVKVARNEAREYSRALSSLAHDMRTPLTGADGYLQLAMEEGDREAMLSRLKATKRRLEDVEGLIDQLALYVFANDPERTYEVTEVCLLPLVLEVLGGYEEELMRKAWEPVISFEDEALSVETDEGALKRIIDNLISNALRYGSGSLRLAQKSSDGSWSLTITNSINSNTSIDASALFERFRGEGAKRLGGGLGLGLSTAKKLAEDMGWSLEAQIDGEELGFVLSAKGGCAPAAPTARLDNSQHAGGLPTCHYPGVNNLLAHNS